MTSNRKKKQTKFILGFIPLFALSCLFILSCQLTQNEKTVRTFSFSAMYDSLSKYDRVVIIVQDGLTGPIDTIFNGKVDALAKIQNLESVHYSGMDAKILISGFMNGKLEFAINKIFDGTTGVNKSEDTLISPKTLGSAPDAPIINSVIAADGQVTISWIPVLGADEYNLYYGEGGAVDKNSTRIKRVTSPYSLLALKNGIAYGFSIAAVNIKGESGLSAVKVATPNLGAVVTPIIDSILGENGKVILSWSSVPDALGYVLYYKSGDGVDKNSTKITNITSPFTLMGLTNGTGYSFALTALKSTGETNLSPIKSAFPVAPSVTQFSYSTSPAVYWNSVRINSNLPLLAIAADSFSINPELSVGLLFNKKTGEISGTPTSIFQKSDYVIKASVGNKILSALVSVQVNGAPTALSYSDLKPVYWQSVEGATNSATVVGFVDSFTIAPVLPLGLQLSKSTGAISGIPSVVTLATQYTVTAHNPAGTSNALLSILVNGPPSGFSYTTNPAVYYVGKEVTLNSAKISGTVDIFSVTPNLPNGLNLNKTNGQITGTPTLATSLATYTVTAKNLVGSPTVTLTITIVGPPSALNYSSPTVSYFQNISISQNTASIIGVVDSFTISPALPQGLVLNKSTGSISGTPTQTSNSAAYLVTAFNSAGSTSVNLNLAVNAVSLGTLTYSNNPGILWKGIALTSATQFTPTVTGGANDFSISPALPSGLSLDKVTGVISGTPTTEAAIKTYVVAAKNNSGGSASANLVLTVNGPPVINYLVQSATYNVNTVITVNTLANSGGPANSFSITPVLPSGLSLNTSSGSITGTPLSSSSAANYVITATNLTGIGKDTISIVVNNATPTVVTIPVNKDIGIDTANLSSYNVGAGGFCWFGKWQGTEQAFLAFSQYDLSSVSATGIKSAKIVFKTYAYMETNTFWDGSPKSVKAHVYSLNNNWTEGTGNWFYHNGAWSNGGELYYGTYGLSDALKASSTDPAIASGLVYTDHEIVRSQNITVRGPVQNISVNYGSANTHSPFQSPLPDASKLIDLEIDVTDYVKLKAGTPSENGIMVLFEGLPTGAWIGSMTKEMGDGSYGSKMVITY